MSVIINQAKEKDPLYRIIKISVWVIFIFFLSFIRMIAVYSDGYEEDIYLTFAEEDGFVHEIKLYQNEDGYHAFFPSNTDLSNISFQTEENVQIIIDNKRIGSSEEISIDDIERIKLRFGNNPDSEYPLFLHQSDNLYSLWIDTKTGSLDNLYESKENKESVQVICLKPDGSVDLDMSGKIKCHGYTTFYYADKKSYQLKFDDSVQLIGMDNAKKWILTSNIFDSSKVRNAISYYIAQKLELPYAIDTEYVDLYINGEYKGNYLIHDSMDIGENRIDIPVEGSYLIVTGHREGEKDLFFTDDYGNTYSLKDPDYLEEQYLELIRNMVNEVQKVILELDEDDGLENLDSLIDVDSLATMFLIDEIIDEVDTNVWSTYYYYNSEDGLIHAGPAWDFDRSIGGVIHFNNYSNINSFINGFPEQLWKNINFRKLVKDKLKNHPDLYNDTVGYLDETVDKISKSIEMDKIIWGNTMGGFVDTGDLNYNIEYVRHFFKERFELIKNVVENPEEYASVNIIRKGKERTIWVKKGEKLSYSQLDYLCESYNCEYFTFGNGTKIWDNFPILDDLVLTIGPEKTEQVVQKEGETRMDAINYLIFILMFFPGLLTLLISGRYKDKKISELLIHYGSYTFCIVFLTFSVMYLVMGEKTINWGGVQEGFDYSMSHIGVAFKILLLQFSESIVLGGLIRLMDKLKKKENLEAYN